VTAQNTRKPFAGEANGAPANPLAGGEGLAAPSPRTPFPRSRHLGPRLSSPTPTLVPTPLAVLRSATERQYRRTRRTDTRRDRRE